MSTRAVSNVTLEERKQQRNASVAILERLLALPMVKTKIREEEVPITLNVALESVLDVDDISQTIRTNIIFAR